MSIYQIRVQLSFVCVLLLFASFLAETASAQLFRRSYRQIPASPAVSPPTSSPRESSTPYSQPTPFLSRFFAPAPNYRVAPPLNESLIQGDGRILERVRNIVNLFTEGGLELKPVAVISFASFEEFKRVLQITAREIRLDKGSTEEPALLNAFLSFYERIVGQGFDTNQPLGMVLQTDGILYYPLFFTPLNWNSKLGQSFKKDYTEQLPDGRYAIRQDVFKWSLGRLYIRQYNGWLFVATEQQLNALPNDPTILLQGLDRKHLMAARFDLQNLPSLTTRAALSLSEMQAVAQAETELEKAAARLGIGFLRSLAEQADFLEYTVSYDEANVEYVIEQKEIVKPNTERAKLLQARRDAQSPFHAFYYPENAILAGHLLMNLTQSQRKEIETMLDQSLGQYLLTEEERQELKKRADEEKKPAKKRRFQETQTDSAENNSTSAQPETKPVDSKPQDSRDRLAELLAMVPPEQLEKEMQNDAEIEPETMPDILISKTSGSDLTGAQKLEIIFRRIGVAYYWGLIGAVRSGNFDCATTCSFEHGILGIYNIIEGKKFREAFDAIFADLEKEFPDIYVQNIRKDYMKSEDFSLTRISFRPSMFIKNPFLSWLIPSEWKDRETQIILGVRNDAICFAIGSGDFPETQILQAIDGTKQSVPVYDLFFTFSAYELGLAFANSGDPNRFIPLKIIAANTNPNACAFAVSKFTDTSKILTLRVSALLTPSLWRFRENLQNARSSW